MIRQKIHALVEPGVDGGKWYDWLMVGMIVTNLVAVILLTDRSVRVSDWGLLLIQLEFVTTLAFIIDFSLRLCSSDTDPRYRGPKGTLRYLCHPWTLLDLFTVIIPLFLGFHPLATARVLRLLKYMRPLRTVGHAIWRRRQELTVAFGLVLVLLLATSSAMWVAEREAQPDKFGSIPQSMWWAVITLATIGYGDVYPVTPIGKALTGILALVGIGIVALPTGILTTAFSEEMKATGTKLSE